MTPCRALLDQAPAHPAELVIRIFPGGGRVVVCHACAHRLAAMGMAFTEETGWAAQALLERLPDQRPMAERGVA